jgi:SUR7/PalI family.
MYIHNWNWGCSRNKMLTIFHSAVFVQGRHAFNSNGQKASLGVKAFAFMWTASVCQFLSCLLYCLGGAVGRKDTSSGYSGRKERRRGFFSSQRSNSVKSQKKEATNYA